MAWITGIVLALLTAMSARVAGLDRDRAFYPTLVIVIASYYVLFAAMGASERVLAIEAGVTVAFAVVAIAGFKSNLWLVAGALALHGVFDLVHGNVIANPGVPAWWPAFCSAYDVVLAACVAWVLRRGRPNASPHEHSDPG
jgi:hypothetical protein